MHFGSLDPFMFHLQLSKGKWDLDLDSKTWVRMPAQPSMNCETLDMPLYLRGPQFLAWKVGTVVLYEMLPVFR